MSYVLAKTRQEHTPQSLLDMSLSKIESSYKSSSNYVNLSVTNTITKLWTIYFQEPWPFSNFFNVVFKSGFYLLPKWYFEGYFGGHDASEYFYELYHKQNANEPLAHNLLATKLLLTINSKHQHQLFFCLMTLRKAKLHCIGVHYSLLYYVHILPTN